MKISGQMRAVMVAEMILKSTRGRVDDPFVLKTVNRFGFGFFGEWVGRFSRFWAWMNDP